MRGEHGEEEGGEGGGEHHGEPAPVVGEQPGVPGGPAGGVQHLTAHPHDHQPGQDLQGARVRRGETSLSPFNLLPYIAPIFFKKIFHYILLI